jgi:multidrug efflux pump
MTSSQATQTVPAQAAEKQRLWLDSDKMAARRVTVLDVQSALRAQNIELPSGRVENMDREMTIQTRGELKTAEEFNDLVIRTEGATLVRMRDIGRAEAGVEDYRTIARFRGQATARSVLSQAVHTVVAADRRNRRHPAVASSGIEIVFNDEPPTSRRP